MSQESHSTEIVVQVLTLEGLALEELCAINFISHVIRDCKKLQNRNQRFPSTHIASYNEASD